jgi:Hepatocellular carcinoma-associated antigen 59
MAYIEENMRLRRGQNQSDKMEDGSVDPYAELFRKSNHNGEKDEGNVTNSMAMLTAIPEVDLGMEYVASSIFPTKHSHFTRCLVSD